MPAYLQTQVLGNVGNDPELRYTSSGVAVCSVNVAVTERWRDSQTNEKREKTTWVRLTFWRGAAETAAKYIRKGDPLFAVGTPSVSAYSGQDGTPRGSLEIRVDTFQLLGSRGNNAQEAADNGAYEDRSHTMDDIPF